MPPAGTKSRPLGFITYHLAVALSLVESAFDNYKWFMILGHVICSKISPVSGNDRPAPIHRLFPALPDIAHRLWAPSRSAPRTPDVSTALRSSAGITKMAPSSINQKAAHRSVPSNPQKWRTPNTTAFSLSDRCFFSAVRLFSLPSISSEVLPKDHPLLTLTLLNFHPINYQLSSRHGFPLIPSSSAGSGSNITTASYCHA